MIWYALERKKEEKKDKGEPMTVKIKKERTKNIKEIEIIGNTCVLSLSHTHTTAIY